MRRDSTPRRSQMPLKSKMLLKNGSREVELDPRVLLQVLKSIRRGDFTVQVPVEWTGIGGKIADELSLIIEQNSKIIEEVKRVSHAVGKKGQLSERVSIPDATGAWKSEIEAFNGLINDLVRPMNDMARVIGGVAKGDLTQTVALETEDHHLKGEFLKTARTVNEMVRQLDAFAAEVTGWLERSGRKASWAVRRSYRVSPVPGRI
jgi:methyl-accepting chemotaxis protein